MCPAKTKRGAVRHHGPQPANDEECSSKIWNSNPLSLIVGKLPIEHRHCAVTVPRIPLGMKIAAACSGLACAARSVRRSILKEHPCPRPRPSERSLPPQVENGPRDLAAAQQIRAAQQRRQESLSGSRFMALALPGRSMQESRFAGQSLRLRSPMSKRDHRWRGTLQSTKRRGYYVVNCVVCCAVRQSVARFLPTRVPMLDAGYNGRQNRERGYANSHS